MSDPISVRFESTLYEQLKAAKPTFLSTTDFIQCMAAQGLAAIDTGVIVTERARQAPAQGERSVLYKEVIEEKEIKTRKKSPFSKQLDPEVIPEELQDCADQIIEFWAVKKGTRSEGAATRLFNKLSTMAPMDRIKALNEANDSGWATVFPPKVDTPAQSRANSGYTEPQFKHPAHQVFTAADFQ